MRNGNGGMEMSNGTVTSCSLDLFGSTTLHGAA